MTGPDIAMAAVLGVAGATVVLYALYVLKCALGIDLLRGGLHLPVPWPLLRKLAGGRKRPQWLKSGISRTGRGAGRDWR